MQMEPQDTAIANTLKEFLKKSVWWASKELLDEYFELINDWDWITYIHLKTPMGMFSHGYTTDVEPDDLENIFAWVVSYSKRILYWDYGEDV